VVVEKRDDRTDVAGNDGGWTRNPDPNDASWGGNAWGGNIDPNNNGVLDPEEEGLIAPGQFRVGSILEKKKRNAFTGKVEWRPSDNFKLVVDGLSTKLDSPQVGYQQSFYPLYAPGRWSNMVIQDGIVTSFDWTIPIRNCASTRNCSTRPPTASSRPSSMAPTPSGSCRIA
jgi:iron complex outermembrane receptor protein